MFGNTGNKKTVSGTLASGVADAGTFTVSYPNREAPESGITNAGDFLQAFYHQFVVNGATLVYPDDFTLTFGTSSITVTNKTGATWPSGAAWTLSLDSAGKKVYGANLADKAVPMARVSRADAVLVSLGAPDTASANGICASQSIAAGTASTSTSATLDGALASTNATTGTREVVLDVPRNVVGTWTTSSVVTIEGYDEYGQFMVEKSASTTTLTGKKAFKRITRVWSTVAITSATIGTGDVLGLPIFLPGRAAVLAEIVDGNLTGDGQAIRMPFQINNTDQNAGTVQQIVSPVAGRITKISTVIQAVLGDISTSIGIFTATVNGAVVTGSSLTSYSTAAGGNGSIGDTASVNVPADSAGAVVAAGDVIGIVPSAAWLSTGAVNGTVEIAPTGSGSYNSGTFVAGLTAGGGSTATSADVRGTYTPPAACDGSLVFQLLMSLPDVGNRGTSQYATP